MNDLFLCLPVLLPIAAGFAGYAIPFKTRRARSAYYGAVISLTAVLAWVGILLCRGEAVKLLTFTESAALVFRMDGADVPRIQGRNARAVMGRLIPFRRGTF